MKHFSISEKSAGELAVHRYMSEKAKQVYDTTDPITVAEYSVDGETFYFVDVCGNYRENLTLEEAEEFLEDNYFEE